MGHGAAGADGAIVSDLDARADHGVRADQGAGSDFGGWSDHRERIDRDVTARAPPWDAPSRPARRQRCRTPKSDAARCRRSCARLRQRRHTACAPAARRRLRAHGGAKPLAGQHGAGLGRCERRDEFGFGTKVRSPAPAWSTGAMPVTRRARSAPSHGSAPVNAAISATLKPAALAKKLNSVTCPPPQAGHITRQGAIPKPNPAGDGSADLAAACAESADPISDVIRVRGTDPQLPPASAKVRAPARAPQVATREQPTA